MLLLSQQNTTDRNERQQHCKYTLLKIIITKIRRRKFSTAYLLSNFYATIWKGLQIPCAAAGILATKRNSLCCVSFLFSETSCECKHSVKFLKTKRVKQRFTLFCCGEKGIRTPGTRKSTTVFETAPFDHSGISPKSFSAIKNVFFRDSAL